MEPRPPVAQHCLLCSECPGMQLMVEGDKWELYIPSYLGYGDHGSPPKISGDSALVFTIEMIEIQGEKVIVLTWIPNVGRM